MTRITIPDLKGLMDKRLLLKLNNDRQVTGVLRGFDPFLNLVIEGVLECKENEPMGTVVVRGNSIIALEALETLQEA